MEILETRTEQLSYAHEILRAVMPGAEISTRRHFATRALDVLPHGSVYSTELREALEGELLLALEYANREAEENLREERLERRAAEREEMFR